VPQSEKDEEIHSGASCGCLRSLQVDFNFVLASSLQGVQKKSMVGQLLCGAKDNGEGG
jgi:hypothetical protein